jgi:MerR family transcriptional regulator/heat shock protein HspR
MDLTGPAADRGVYGITTAAELVGTGVQNLRAYERHGLLEPARTEGGTRRYSERDLDRLRRIGELLAAGLNLAGVSMVLHLQDENAQLRAAQEAQPWLQTAPIGSPRTGKHAIGRRSGPRPNRARGGAHDAD